MATYQEIKKRIFTAAADKLYAANIDGNFPNIETVRQLNRARMSQ